VSGTHTFTVIATSPRLGDSEPASVTFEADGTPPSFTVTPTSDGLNLGGAHLAVAVTGDTTYTIEANLRLQTTDVSVALIPNSCTCDDVGACDCEGLAPGTNQIATRVADACGNLRESTDDVDVEFGPNRGHAIVLGHDYSDPSTPDVVGNAAAQAPFIADGFDIDRRNLRVLAWRSPGVASSTVDNATDAITRVLDELNYNFDATTPLDYVELPDPADLPRFLRGRDVFLMFEPDATFDDGELDQIADDWAAELAAFTDAGGVVIALHSDQGWRLLGGGATPLVAMDAGYAVPSGGGVDPDYVMHRYPASAIGAAYPLVDGIEDGYTTPQGTGCVDLADTSATVVLDHVAASCGDGCAYDTCATVVDQRLPRYAIEITPNVDVDPYPACVPDGVGLDSDGSFAITLPAAPGSFACSYAPVPGYLEAPDPQPCTIEASGDGYTIAMAGAPRDELAYVDITYLDNGVPQRTGRTTVRVDGRVFASAPAIPDGSCATDFLVREYQPAGLDEDCAAMIPAYLPVASVTCTLERELTPGMFVTVASYTGTGCNAVPAPGGGFASNTYTIDWSADIVEAGASGNLRATFTTTDFHGNTGSRVDTWVLSSPSSCGS
jgi:hypothetical protein